MSKSKYMHFFSGDGEASTPWYLAGGVDPSNCVAAYQAKGAADYATSKVNLANPGTRDLTEQDGTPTWSAEHGYHALDYYNTSDPTPHFLTNFGTSVFGHGTGTIIILYELGDYVNELARMREYWDTGGGNRIGFDSDFSASGVIPYYETTIYASNGGDDYDFYLNPDGEASLLRCLACAGNKFYYQGTFRGLAADWWDGDEQELDTFRVLRAKDGSSGFTRYFNIYWRAGAWYSTTLTAEQVAAITTAMQAL